MSIQDQFVEAQGKLKTLPAQDNEVLLNLYALYKQSTEGDVSGNKPGMFDIVKKAKYEAWASRKGLSKESAMAEYVKLVSTLVEEAAK
ncbi:MAG TPA: acyl-CoA-binding protein [Deltaproteobacteria bacterium]|nr:MAG: acyl-CoA-binding protein [Deltaproteobacteria bacterium GWA2_45_12]HBF12761.1 acyl-CoA-binding protein [Deltaproteobacteria bacterium]